MANFITNPPALNPMLGDDPFPASAVELAAQNASPLKAQAAMLSMLQGSYDKALENYQRIQNSPNDPTQAVMDSLRDSSTAAITNLRNSFPDLMADPTVPFEEKEAALNAFRDGTAKAPDTAIALAQDAALKNPNFKVPDSTYDMKEFWGQMSRTLQERQQIVNMVNSTKDGTLTTAANLAGLFAPFADANTMRVLQGTQAAQDLGMGGKAYAMMLPGSFMQEMHAKIKAKSPEEQNEILRSLVDAVKQSSSLLDSDNSLRAIATMGDLAGAEYSNFDKYWTNLTGVLDLMGVPAALKLGGNLALKGAGAAKSLATGSRESGAAQALVRAGRDIPIDNATGLTADVVKADMRSPLDASDLASVSGRPTVDTNAPSIRALEEQKARVLEEPTEPLAPATITRLQAERDQLVGKLEAARDLPSDDKKGGTSMALRKVYADVVADTEARIRRIDDALDTNRMAENNLQVIADIDKEITALRKAPVIEDAKPNAITDALRQQYIQTTMFTAQPRTVLNIVGNVNPPEARKLHLAMLMDESDETAKAVAGVSRNEALVQSVTPQATVAGKVRFVPTDIEQDVRLLSLGKDPLEVINNADSGLRYLPVEIERGRANIVKDYSEVQGIQLHPAMSSFQLGKNERDVVINGVYSAGENPWDNAQHALDQTRFALRRRGISEDQVGLLVRQGDEFIPISKEEALKTNGEYFTTVKASHNVSDGDIGPLENVDVRYNFFDSFRGTITKEQGSLQTHILPTANMLHPVLTGSMTVATDRTSVLAEALLKQLDAVTTPFMALPKSRQKAVEAYWVEANAKRIPYDSQDALARGINSDELPILRNFRTFQDTMWDLENRDLVKGLTSQNYGWFEGTHFQGAVKNPSKKPDYNINMIYDSINDIHRPINANEIKALYNAGGYIGELRHPVVLNGEEVSHVMVRQVPGEYTRTLNPTDRILEKRDGYYQTIHKNGQFVEAKYMANGKEKTEVIGVVSSIKEAKELKRLYEARNPTHSVSYRGDEKTISRSSNEYWQLNTQGGRIAQRHRSKLVESTVNNGDALHIEAPIESSIRALQSIAGRTAMRPVLDTSKKRFMDQFGELVAPDVFGQRHFPKSVDEIIRKGDADSKFIRDARTTFNYIQTMENGYVNLLDAGVRAGFRKLANIFGELDMAGTERVLRKGESANATASAKSTVFSAYIATIPWRQWLIQGNGGLRAFGYNPMAFINGRAFDYFQTAVKDSFKVPLNAEQKAFKEFMESTGMYQAVSKNNLIRGSMMDASERRGTLGKVIDGPLGTMRKIGFDAGEHFNLWIHGAAVYDEYIRKGANVNDARVKAQMHEQIRALTYDMNYAGDLPYNQNSLSLLMTYMQVPHKAVANAFNRRLPVNKRIQMALFDYSMWGLPKGVVESMYGETWDKMDPEAQTMARDGIEAWALNKILSEVAGERVAGDWSSLNPVDMEGWYKMWTSFLDEGPDGLIEGSATGKLLADGNGRTWMAAKMTAQYFKDFREADTVADPTKLTDVLNAWASVSSGWNSLQQARIKWMLGEARDKRGGITDDKVNKTEAVLAGFSIGTKDTKDFNDMMYRDLRGARKAQTAGQKDADMMVRLALMKHPTAPAHELAGLFMQTMISTRHMLPPEEGAAYWSGAVKRLHEPASYKAIEHLNKSIGLRDTAAFKEDVRLAPIPQEQKDFVLQVYQQRAEAEKTLGFNTQRK